jgi:hypothetical protein
LRARIALGLCAVAAVAVAAVLLVNGGGDEGGGGGVVTTHGRRTQPSPPRAARARSSGTAAAFLDSIGVGLHLNYFDTSYGRQPEILARIGELGVRHVREGVPFKAPVLVKGLRALARRGVRATLVTDVKIPPAVGVAGGLRAMGSRVEAFEGPNELDISGLPNWKGRLDAYMRALRSAMRGARTRVPVVGPSFVDPEIYESVARAEYDAVNLHPYPGGNPPEEQLDAALGRVRAVAPSRPIELTETGYHNALAATGGQPPVPEQAAAVYFPRLYLSAFRAGVRRTFVYELADEKPDPALREPEQHFGLLRQDLSPKPAFDAVRNLIREIRRSPGPASNEPPAPSIRPPDGVDHVLLTRTDGSRVLALWRPVSVWDRDRRRPVDPGTVAVGVRWSRPVRDLTVTRPSRGDQPVTRLRSGERVDVDLGADVVLLSYR